MMFPILGEETTPVAIHPISTYTADPLYSPFLLAPPVH